MHYHDIKLVEKIIDVEKDNTLIRKLMKSKKESYPRLDQLKDDHMMLLRCEEKSDRMEIVNQKKEEEKQKETERKDKKQ